MQRAAELAGLELVDEFHDAQEEAPTAEIEVQQEHNFLQQVLRTMLKFGWPIIAALATAKAGGSNGKQHTKPPSTR